MVGGKKHRSSIMGSGFEQGDIVTVKADIITGEIEWIVNKTIQADYMWKKLENKKINWVLYLDMGRQEDIFCKGKIGDIVEIID